jgi:hypothetical protein
MRVKESEVNGIHTVLKFCWVDLNCFDEVLLMMFCYNDEFISIPSTARSSDEFQRWASYFNFFLLFILTKNRGKHCLEVENRQNRNTNMPRHSSKFAHIDSHQETFSYFISYMFSFSMLCMYFRQILLLLL